MLLGDQVYADETSPTVRRLLRRRRGGRTGAPADQVVSFDEYTKLYLESWRDPEIRWLLSTVPSVMIFDDHEIIDDWNTSASWRADMREQPWWAERITSGLASYWVYQHLGNLAPDEIAADPVYAEGRAPREDATEVLREFGAPGRHRGRTWPHDTERWRAVQYQWSYALDLGRTRLVMLDNRCSRVLEPGHRAMLPPGEWSWFVDQAHGDYDHLVVGSSLPWLLPPGIHHVEAWNERLADSPRPWVAPARREAAPGARPGALGRVPPLVRRARRAVRPHRQRRPGQPGARVGAGPAYPPPASISVLSGDVHHSYVARARFADPAGGHAGAPADLLADPQPGAGRDAPADAARLVGGAGRGDPGAGPHGRGTPPAGALAPAGRAVLRQRGGHAAHAVGGRGDDRGHPPRRQPRHRRPPPARRGLTRRRPGTAARVGPSVVTPDDRVRGEPREGAGMVQVDTAALRAAAKRLRDEAADGVREAVRATRNTDDGRLLIGFDQYGSQDGYRAVSQAWRDELDALAEALRQLADAMEKAAENYERSDERAAARTGGGGAR